MTLNIPEDEQQVIDQTRADIQEVLPGSNASIPNSALDALAVSTGGRNFDFYRQLEELILQLFIDTAEGEFLDRLASSRDIIRFAATEGTGNIIFTGTPGSTVPISTTLQSSDGESYLTQAEATIAANSISVTIERVGTVATVTAASAHNLATGLDVTISGADQTEYNGVQSVNVIDETTFSYTVAGSPATPATGTILAAYDSAFAPIESDNEGEDVNLAAGAELTLGSPISGITTAANLDFAGVTGGADLESDTSFRARAIDKWQNPNTPFNVAGITTQAKLVAGVTRVFVQEITPAVGQVTVYFTRDNDDDGPIPSAGEVTEVKDNILLIKPAHTSDADVIVEAPAAVTVNFTISGISPSTTTMQDSIRNNLDQLFAEGTSVGVTLLRNDYISAVNRTVDTVTGDVLEVFTINNPVGDIAVASNELPVLGTVSFT